MIIDRAGVILESSLRWVPGTRTGAVQVHYVNPNADSLTINGRLNGLVAVDTPAAAAQFGFMPKPSYRVDSSRPVVVGGNYQPTLPTAMSPWPPRPPLKPYGALQPSLKACGRAEAPAWA